VDLQSVVEMFKRVGARCRKVRGKNEYECWGWDLLKAVINEYGITIIVNGEFRPEYLRTTTYDGREETYVLEELKKITGADTVDYEVPCADVRLILGFSLDKARRAVEVFKKMTENELWIAITNMKGELRLYRGGEQVYDTEEWLELFK